MKKYPILFIVIVISGIIACKKDSDTLGPTVTINSPTSGEMISSGDSVLIDVLAEDEDMHEVTFSVVNAADTSIVYFEDGLHSHDVDVHYVQKFKAPAVLAHTPVILNVHTEDHNEHATDKSVTFAIMP